MHGFDCLDVALTAVDADAAAAQVCQALTSVNQPPPFASVPAVPALDARTGQYRVAVALPDDARPADAAATWMLAHAVAAELGGDARVTVGLDGDAPRVDVAPSLAPQVARLDDGERAELQQRLTNDATARQAWQAGRAAVPPGASRRLQLALTRAAPTEQIIRAPEERRPVAAPPPVRIDLAIEVSVRCVR